MPKKSIKKKTINSKNGKLEKSKIKHIKPWRPYSIIKRLKEVYKIE